MAFGDQVWVCTALQKTSSLLKENSERLTFYQEVRSSSEVRM